jgi:hypothetical protein
MPRPTAPPDAKTLQACLDRLGQIITRRGRAGAVFLPIYDRLERELAARRAIDARLAEVRARTMSVTPSSD